MRFLDLLEKFRDTDLPELGVPRGRGAMGLTQSYKGAPYTVVKWLNTQGWQEAGTGGFSSVFVSPEYPDQVMKVMRNDPAYIRFYSLAKRSQNPHFPEVGRIASKKFPDGSNMFLVMIEKLGGPRRDHELFALAEVSHAILMDQADIHYEHPEIGPRFKERVDWIKENFPLWFPALTEIKSIMKPGSKLNSDMHAGNIRWRDSGRFPVITDPLWYGDS